MGRIIEKFTFDRNTFKNSSEASAHSVAEHIGKVARGDTLDKVGSNIVGALASYMGIFKKEDGRFVQTDLARAFLNLFEQNETDAWQWLVARSLWRYVVPNGTFAKVNEPARELDLQFSFFHSILQLLTHLAGESGDARFLYFEEICILLNDDDAWKKSGSELFVELASMRMSGGKGFLSKRSFLEDLEDGYRIPRDNFAGLFVKALRQTGLFELKEHSKKTSAIALNPKLEPALLSRMRYIIDHPVKWSGENWAGHLDLQPEDLPLEVAKSRANAPTPATLEAVDLTDMVNHFCRSLENSGVSASKITIHRFIASLLTKRLLILTGLSGSGKTKIAQAFARWITTEAAVTDPFKPGNRIEAERMTYLIKNSDSLGVEFWNNENREDATIVHLPRELISEWARFITENNIPKTAHAQRDIREAGVKDISRFSPQLHSFETHLKAAAFAEIEAIENPAISRATAVVPVGADWTSREQMLGYPDGINPDHYVKQAALTLILEASRPENRERPFFLILDEMNLSHVERYFSDFLSAIESGEKIPMHENAEPIDGVKGRLELPENLFVIGTVNVDETTYMFSPKVLDRANVIEFRVAANEFDSFVASPSAINLDELCEKDAAGRPTAVGLGAAYGTSLVDGSRREIDRADLGKEHDEVERELKVLFRLFLAHGWDFGYRVGIEISRLAFFHRMLTSERASAQDALDAAIIQKLMPKLNGSEGRLREILKVLAWYCSGKEESIADGIYDINEIAGRVKALSKQARGTLSKDPEKVLAENLEGEIENATYPLSFEKTLRMWRALKLNGFTSFAEN